MQNYFIIDEDFSKIIYKSLKEKMGVSKVNKINVISSGWTNIVYRAECNNGNYYLRFPRDEFWGRTIVKDYEFAKYIQGKTSFNTVNLELGYDQNRPFSIHKEIEGVPLVEKMDSMSEENIEKVSKQISKFMYELHNLKFNKNDIFNTQNIATNLNDFIDELLNVHVSSEDRKFWKINNFKSPNNCLVHGDLNSSNVLINENNDVTAIIDFGFGGFGNKYQDISRIIGRCPTNFKNHIVKNYEKLEQQNLNLDILNKDIKTWNDIDQGYINYMRKIGIYK